jgi:hypothetical protein
MNRRGFLAGAVAVPVLGGCIYRDDLTLQWDEDVLLHDGQKIVVNIKRRFERSSSGFTKYGGHLIDRDTTLTFDAGGQSGRVSQLFKGFKPIFIGFQNDAWYVLLTGAHYRGSDREPGQNWGAFRFNSPQVAKLVGYNFASILLEELPADFKVCNLMLPYGKAGEVADFNGKRVTLDMKQAWKELYPPGYGHGSIVRPPMKSTAP